MKKIAADPNAAAHETIRCTGGRSNTRRLSSFIRFASSSNTGRRLLRVTGTVTIPRLMRWSGQEVHTLREVPAEAGPAHRKLMLRAGLIRKDGELHPLGLRSIRKLEALVREETLPEILHDCALDPVPVESDTGTRLVVPTAGGELRFLGCPGCGYAADFDAAASKFFHDEVEPAPAEPPTAPA